MIQYIIVIALFIGAVGYLIAKLPQKTPKRMWRLLPLRICF